MNIQFVQGPVISDQPQQPSNKLSSNKKKLFDRLNFMNKDKELKSHRPKYDKVILLYQPFQPYDLTKIPKKPLKIRKVHECQQDLSYLISKKCPCFFQLIQSNQYIPLQPLCDSLYDRVSTLQRLQEISKNKQMTVQKLCLKSKDFIKVIIVSEKIKILEGKEFNQRKNFNSIPCFWARQEQQFIKVYRWEIMFEGEDRCLWIDKVVDAAIRREQMDSILRMKYYIQNMTTQDLNNLQEHIVDQIRKKLKYPAQKEQIERLLDDVNKDFIRNQNQMLFKTYIKGQDASNLFSKPLSIPKVQSHTVPDKGKLKLQKQQGQQQIQVLDLGNILKKNAKTFQEMFKQFGLASLYSVKQVLIALRRIKETNMGIKVVDIFDSSFQRGYAKIEDFKHNQDHFIHKALRKLVQVWPRQLQQIVKSQLKISRQNKSKLLQQQRLSRLLQMIKFMMKDILLVTIRKNYYSFYDMLLCFLPDQTIIHNSNKVENIFVEVNQSDYFAEDGELIFYKGKRKTHPLLLIQLLLHQNGVIDYSFSLKQLKEIFMAYFQKTIDQLSYVPDLESKLMPRFQNFQIIKGYVKSPTLKKISSQHSMIKPQNQWLLDLYQNYKILLQKMLQPLKRYITTFKSFDSLLNQNLKDYLSNQSERQISQLTDQISDISAKSKAVYKELTDSVQIGIFNVNVNQIKKRIIGRYQERRLGLIGVLQQKLKQNMDEIIEVFDKMHKQINKQIQDIEGLTEVIEYINGTAYSETEKQNIQIKKANQLIDIIQGFQVKMSPEELARRFKMVKMPKVTQDMMTQRNEQLQREKQKYQDTMLAQQIIFKKELDAVQRQILMFHQNNKIQMHQSIAASVNNINKTLTRLQQQARKFNSRQQLFSIETTDYTKLQSLTKDFAPYTTLWTTTDKWFNNIDSWMDDPFQDLDAVGVQKFIEDGGRGINQVFRFFKDKGHALVAAVAQKMKGEIQKFKPNVPLMVALRKQGMKQRHWNAIQQKVGFQINPQQQDFTFRACLKMGLLKHVDTCVDVGQRAAKQYTIQTMLKEMWKIWEDINFDIANYKSTGILRGSDQVAAIVDQHLVNTQAMQFSPFKKPFQEQILKWASQLKLMSDILEEWAKCQGNWMYLQPIFQSADIAKQLPVQSKKFRIVDVTWKQNITLARQHQNVLKVCLTQGLLEKIKDSNQKLQQIQKQLNAYLQKKRERFARFYFLSNDDLLQILSQTKQPTAVQPHLKKVFQNINQIQFDKKKYIHAMFSAQKQRIGFVDVVDPNLKNVEDWMGQVEQMMKMSVREQLKISVSDYVSMGRPQWVKAHPGQCVLNGSQIVWTQQVEQAIVKNKLEQYFKKANSQLHQLVDLVRQKLTKQQQVTINALIVIDVHAKDVVQKLLTNQIKDVSSFEWISQLRYYWQKQNCYVKCVQTNFPYGYQYLGNTLRLVITPLTDKCYMTLMGALKLNLGGAPAGPAGTGKTQSTKDLAKALAKQCVVFNCSDSMDYIMVAKFFKGLASAGAWCCFDQFNRINIQVLSVIAQQLLILFGQKAKGSSVCQFQGSVIKIQPTFSVFVTMNPGYAGRTQLPDNLKALFRAVAMMVPDYAMIGEIMLYSFGFTKGRDLAKKMVATFKLSSQQLSSQDHYDYGMRAVRSVINAAGLLKQADPDMNQDQLLLRALRDVNVPKFLKDDLPLFQNIITDLFPGVQRPKIDYGLLLQALQVQTVKLKLQPIQPFIQKVIQLYDTILVRHGLMLVGPTGGAKSTCEKILAFSMTSLKDRGQSKVHLHILNPKSITMGQLYGAFNQQTHEWADGVLAFMVRQCVRDQSTQKHWIIFDGPVDSLWIQSMNTVLDDNKKLCLNSGQMLQLTPHMTMMFEVQDLAVASPATVSRCGMVYLQPSALGHKPLIHSWFKRLPQTLTARTILIQKLQRLFDQHVNTFLQFVILHIKQLVVSSQSNLTASLLRLLDCFLQAYKQTQVKKISPQQYQHLEQCIQSIFIFCLIWSMGCTGDLDSRKKFNVFYRQSLTKYKYKNTIPEEKTVYDYEFRQKQLEWVEWQKSYQHFQVDPKLQYHQIAIPTNQSTRTLYIAKILLVRNYHVMFPGPTGTGKSQNSYKLLTTGMPEAYQYISLTFSAQTSANQTQDTIDQKLQKRRKGHFGPPIGKKCVIFVDDLNMPKKELYGAQPPIELFRQYIDHHGWYNRKDLVFMHLQDLIIMSAMGPPGGGRTFITNRVIRHFNLITYTEMQSQAILHIFNSLLTAFFRKFVEGVRGMVLSITDACLNVFNSSKDQLLPTPSKSHYTFNLRDIWKVVQGICSASTKYNSDPKDILTLWFHENMRVYHDRLINNEDRQLFIKVLQNQNQLFSQFTEHKIKNSRIVFCDFMQGRQAQPRQYHEIDEQKKMLQKIDDYLQEFNIEAGSKKSMKLIMFLDACQHIARITRILKQPQGNALLLGVGGSGRQSLSKLSTFISSYKLFQIEVIKNYSMRNWREDIKEVLLMAGLQNKPVTFLFVDTQIINEQMLQDLNSILNSGDVTNIYQQKDMQQIMTQCRGDCAKKNLQPNKMNVFAMYLARVKRNIHIVMAMSPLGQAFATRLRMFPSLVNCCTIDWFSQWPQEALIGVGKGQLIDYQSQLQLQGKIQKLVEMFKNIHKSVEHISIAYKQQLSRLNFVTPTSYLELLSMYKTILREKQIQSKNSIYRLQNGLDKLADANVAVEDMQVTLTKMQPQLVQASEETEKLMEKLTVDKVEAEKVQIFVSKQQAQAAIQTKQAQALASKASAAVAQANAILDATLKQVQKLKKQHIVQVKSLTSPSKGVRVTLGGVVILTMDYIKKQGGNIIMDGPPGQKQQNYFQTAKKYLLSDANQLLILLKTYDKNNINAGSIKKLQEKIIPDSDFTLERARNCSYAVQFLYSWVKAMYDYHNVYLQTKPLRQKLQATQGILKQKKQFLKQKKSQLDKVNKQIQQLEDLFSAKTKQKQELQNQIQECKVKLQRAKKLTTGLSDQQKRWALDVKFLRQKALLIAGDSVIASGMVAYAGPFTAQYRNKLQTEWREKLVKLQLAHQQGITMRIFLGVPVEIQRWNIAGLPKDDTSTQNGVIIFKSRRWPLMIDPQTQANKFIKNIGKEHQQGIQIMKVTQQNLMRSIQLAVQFGKWILLQNVSKQLDPSLQPILLQKIIKAGTTYSITIGQKTLSYNQHFKFLMTTTVPNPQYSPQTFVKVCIINFAITPSGLEEQMLAKIVALENPQLQQKKLTIVLKNAQDKKTLIELQNSILKALSSTQGNIDQFLKDESLINQLSNSKKMSHQINIRVEQSKQMQKTIDQTREGYRSVAFRSSLLFFCILDLSLIDPMYQYSLQWFSNLFVMGVQNSPASSILQERLQNMNNFFTYSLYQNVCRSLFQKQKLLFSFLLTVKILFGDKKMDEIQWRYLLAGPSGQIQIPANPTDWVPQNQWPDMYRQFYGMGKLQAFKGIQNHFINNSDKWRHIFDSITPNDQIYPDNWNSMSQFQKIIILKSLRADRIILSIQKYVSNIMGQRFIIVPTFDLNKCYKDSTITTPLIFVLSAGSDPVSDFLRFAEQMGFSKRYEAISLGQGQGVKAEKMIRQSTVKGSWVLLQNCHLAISWMSQLERICEELNDNLNKDFRLWLTSMPTSSFPISILQNGVKMTLQPPQGLRNNLLRTYTNMDQKQFDQCSKPTQYKRLLFGFSLFHAVVQDRRKFGAIGWNIPYEFTNQDLGVCKKQLKMLLQDYEQVPYKVLNYLGAQINYGGRVTDDKDVRLITTILKLYINSSALQVGYKFSQSGIYYQPDLQIIQQYIQYIESLPLNPSPEAFGLDDNAQITNNQNQTFTLLESILSVQPKATSSKGKSRQQIIEQIATDVQSRTPQVFPIHQVSRKYPTQYNQSMNTVLVQEVIRYNRLLAVMKVTLNNVKKALKGLIVMSEELDLLANSLYDNQVPKLWEDKGFLSMKPLSSWIQDLNSRISFLKKWIDHGTPIVFWISGFFFPQAFLTGTLQNYARKHIIAIDKLSFEFKYMDKMTHNDVKAKPSDGCYIYGMYLQGARWQPSSHMIQNPKPKQLYSDLPLIHLVPQSDREVPLTGIYQCPVYKVVSRRGTLSTTGHSTNFVMFFQMPTNLTQDIWIRAGVASFLALRY